MLLHIKRKQSVKQEKKINTHLGLDYPSRKGLNKVHKELKIPNCKKKSDF